MSIDFPASPVDQQLFTTAGNGVVYKYSAAYSSWLAQNAAPGIGGTGDFCANQTSGFPAVPTAMTTIIPTQVISGNSGLWYNTSNGRYTPPAGRYCLSASFVAACTTGATHLIIQLRKNGTTLGPAAPTEITTAGANFTGQVATSLIVDTNGSDWFDFQGGSASGSSTFFAITFQAFPLTGLQGPQGPPGGGPPGSDFVATWTSGFGSWPANSVFTMVFPTVVTGNSGVYYNTTTGRYTPPAGRYLISAQYSCYSSTSNMAAQILLYKNGVQVATGVSGSSSSNNYSFQSVSAIVDANGSDWFDIRGWTNVLPSGVSGAQFFATATQGLPGPMGPAGVTQTVFTETGAVASGTTLIPVDDTIPQITEGDQYMTLAITPQSATSKLIIEIVAVVQPSVQSNVTVALFQDSTANALAAVYIALQGSILAPVAFRHTMPSGTTSPTTFRVRIGGSVAGTVTFNGYAGGRIFGGVMASSIVIREVP